MNPLEVSARNYRSFETLPPLALPTGLTALTGENGHGKSSIVNLVDVALFAGRGELTSLVTTGHDEMELELVFEHGAETYRVRRGWRKGKPTVDFEREGLVGDPTGQSRILEGGWETLTRENADATQQLIEQTLGLSRETFRASAFLRQGDDCFTEVDRSKRRQILAQILGLDVWDQALALCRTDLRAAEDSLVKIRTRRETAELVASRRQEIEKAIAVERETETKSATEIAALEKELDEAQAHAAAAAELGARARVCVGELESAEAAKARVGAQLDEARQASQARSRLLVELSEIKPRADLVDELEQHAAARTEAIHRHDAAKQQKRDASDAVSRQSFRVGELRNERFATGERRQEITDRIAHLEQAEDGEERCERCEQILGSEARQAALASLRADRLELDEKMGHQKEVIAEALRLQASLEQECDEIAIPEIPAEDPTLDLERARGAVNRTAAINGQMETLAEKAARVTEWEVEWNMVAGQAEEKKAALAQARAALPTTEPNLDGIRSRLTAGRELQRGATAGIGRCQAELDRIEQAETELGNTAAELATTEKTVGGLSLVERCFSRDGAAALIVEAIAVPQIETEANRILAELGTSYQVELRTQKLTGKGELVEDLDIIIHDGPYERVYETYSGGERTRLNIALRIALARLLARRRGAESRLLVIDEPEYLDEAGVTRLADVLRGLGGDFDRVVLVTHHPSGAASCDVQMHVVKDEHGSRVVDGTEGLWVAA